MCSSVSSTNPDVRCSTEVMETTVTFSWTIGNAKPVCLHSNVDTKLNSSLFKVNLADMETTWQLAFHTRKYSASDYYLYFYLRVVNPERLPKFCQRCDFFAMNAKGKRVDIRTFGGAIYNIHTEYCCEFNAKMFLNATDERRCLQNDKIKFCCDLIIANEKSKPSGEICHSDDLKAEARLIDDLRSLLDSKQFCDVTIVVGEENEFPAHKCFLSARSTVFAAMFQSNMKGSQQNRVTIDDITPDAFKIVLEYIYTGKAENLNKNEQLETVYYASNKYALEDLKKMCEIELSKKITVETASQLAILAELHDGKVLKDRVFIFFIAHSTDVMKTEGWKLLEENHLRLAFDLLRESQKVCKK